MVFVRLLMTAREARVVAQRFQILATNRLANMLPGDRPHRFANPLLHRPSRPMPLDQTAFAHGAVIARSVAAYGTHQEKPHPALGRAQSRQSNFYVLRRINA